MIVFECECGARVRAPGAVPGRSGRCPQCGAALRVPIPPTEPDADIPLDFEEGPALPVDPVLAPSPPSAPPPIMPGYTVQGEELSAGEFAAMLRSSSGRALRKAASRAQKTSAKPVKTSKKKVNEPSLHDSLDYPLRAPDSLLFVGLMPVLCYLPTVFSFGLRSYLFGDNEVQSLGSMTMIFPASIFLALVEAAGLLYLEQVLMSSSRGEDLPPHWSRGSVFDYVHVFFRWIAATFFGNVVGLFVAMAIQMSTAGVSEAARHGWVEVIIAALFGMGAVFWPMGILAVTVHQSAFAANPVTVFRAAMRAGSGLIGIGLLFGVANVVTMVFADLIYQVPSLFGAIVAVYLFWLFVWYEALVLVRRLGLFYQHRAKAIGWE